MFINHLAQFHSKCLQICSCQLGIKVIDDYFYSMNTGEVVLRGANYDPFGMILGGRSGALTGENYRFGFNGMEQGDDTYGDGNLYLADFREVDPRLGRWWSIDPMVKAWESPYVAFADNLIFFADPSGLDGNGPGEEPGKPVDKNGRDASGKYVEPKTVPVSEMTYENMDDFNFKLEPVEIPLKQNFVKQGFRNFKNWWTGKDVGYEGSGWGHGPRQWIGDKLHVNNGADNLFKLTLLSILQYDNVEFKGDALEKIKNDPAILELEEEIMCLIQDDERLGQPFEFTYRTGVQLGGKRGSLNPLNKSSADTWKVGKNELTWMARTVKITAQVQVQLNGCMHITYVLDDRLDLRPEQGGKIYFGSVNRPKEYNIVSSLGGLVYHDLIGGNDQLSTSATWSSDR